MIAKLLKPLLAAITAVLAVKIAEYLTRNTGLNALDIIIFTGCVAAAFSAFAEEFFSFLKLRIRFIRKQLDPRSRFEGVWLISVVSVLERPYAYATIEYNAEGDCYSYRGAAFDTEGNLKASWTCARADIDLPRSEIRFVADAQLVDQHGEMSRAYGHIQFEKNFFGWKARYSRGKGFFVDFGTQSRKAHFILDRLDSKTVKTALGKREVVTHDDMAILIRAQHQLHMRKQTSIENDSRLE